MHIPDGFLDTKVWLSLDIVTGLILGLCIWKANRALGEKQVPFMGMMAAFIFTSQMIMFPVPGGTTGHFSGGTLAAIVLGPCTGMVVIAAILLIQCLVFQDGGLTALGANMFNMGVISVLLSYFIYSVLSRILKGKGVYISSFFAALITAVLAAIACAIELAMSGMVPVKVAMATIGTTYLFIGICEGILTGTVLRFIKRVRPDIFPGS